MKYLNLKEQISEKLAEKVEFDGSKNLLELGLNSLQIMRLINQWRKDGIRVSFGELMENPTLDEWWKIVSKHMDTHKDQDSKKYDDEIEKENIPFELTDVQHAYFIGRDDDAALGGVGCHAYLEFDGHDIEPDKLKKAWNTLQYNHSMLRAKFLDDGTQVIMEKPYCEEIEINDFRNENNIEEKLLEVRDKLSHRKLHIEKGQVAELSLSLLTEGKTRVHFDLDLLVADVQSMQIILRDLAAAYNGSDISYKMRNWNFKSYLKAKNIEEIDTKKDAQIYWQKRLKILPTGPDLPLKKHPEEIQNTRFNRRKIYIEKNDWSKLKGRALENKTTPAMILLTAYSLILERYSSTKKFLINIPVFNRDTKYQNIEDAVSDFTTILLLEVDCTGNPSFLELLKRIQKQFNNDMKYSVYSGVQVQRDLSKLKGIQQNSAPVVFACNLGVPIINKQFKETIGKVNYMISQTPQVWLDFQTYEDEGNLIITWDSVDELFPQNLISRMMEGFGNLLYHVMNENIDSKFDILCDDQKEFIKKECNIKENENPRCIHEAFWENAKRYPESIALIDTKRNVEITYKELREKALSIANGISRLGITNSPIAVTVERGYEQIVSVLGILISGNYYVIVSREQPKERKQLIFNKTGIKYCITKESENDYDIENLKLNELLNEKPVEHIPKVSPENSAYIIMTSGSTGLPKGVEIAHFSAWNTIADINSKYNVNRDDAVLCISSMDFDLSVYDVFGILGSGGKLILIPEEEKRNADYWLKQIEKYNITVWNSVPILMQMLLVAAKAKKMKDISLRLVLLSGDWIPMDLPGELFSLKENCILVAMGGATEASIWSNYFVVNKDMPKHWKSIPYGRPLSGQAYRVMDDYGRDCPYYVKGELVIGGYGVAKGYRGDAELTDKKFFVEKGVRWYRTGDLGEIWEDGTIEFIGRKDLQIKLKGYRIELGEVESAIKKIENVKDCVAGLVKKTKNVKVFAAAVTVKDNNINESSIKSILKDRIPEYMIPSQIYVSKEMEITKNGKRDRKQLIEWIENKVKNNNTKKIKPLTDTQNEILNIWKSIFNNDDISIEDNYFEIGGDSLVATRLIAELKDKYNISIPLSCIFENNTVKLLSKKIEEMTADKTEICSIIPVKHDESQRYKEFDTTEIQYAYWIGRKGIYPLGNVSSYCYYEIECESVDIIRLNDSWQKLINAHDALRMVFSKDGKKQHVLKEMPEYKFKINDFSSLRHEEKNVNVVKIREEMSQQVIDSSKWPLFDIRVTKMESSKLIIHVGIDNMIMDARSVLYVLKEWADIYNDNDYTSKVSEFRFVDYVNSINEFRESAVYKRDKRYWLERIGTFPKSLKFPIKIDPSSIDKQTTIRYAEKFDKTVFNKIKTKAKLYNMTVSSVLMSIYAVVLAEYSDICHYSMNITTDKRMLLDNRMEDVVGDFTSTLLLEVNLIPGEDFILFADRMQKQLTKDLIHMSYSGVEFTRDLNRAVPESISNNVVFTSTIGIENKNTDLFGAVKYNITQTPQVWIDCQGLEQDKCLYINWDFVKELFEKKYIDEMFNKYVDYINRFVKDENFEILSNDNFMEGTL